MKPNPGGILKPHEVIGRQAVIEDLWRILEQQSVLLTAERRMGKSCVIRKMANEATEGLFKYRDLEGIRSPLEFAESVYNDVCAHQSLTRRATDSLKKLVVELSGAELGGMIKFPESTGQHWKRLITSSLEALLTVQERVVFFWDELPLMLHNIARREGEGTAMELLDQLRALRQQHSSLRMVFTGSIGLHNVLAAFKRAGYANSPVNDMRSVELPNLSHDNARILVQKLYEDERIKPASDAVDELIKAVDCIPFYLQHIVDRFQRESHPMTRASVRQHMTACIQMPSDPWQLRHYEERIQTYYQPHEHELVRAILDEICLSEVGLEATGLLNILSKSNPTLTRTNLLELLRQLELDHYLERVDNCLQMRSRILRQSWKYQRGL